MKKTLLILMSLILIICLAGCTKKENKINEDKITIDFIIDGKSYLVEIDKGTLISKEIIPLSEDEELVGLYYDKNMENEYDSKVLNEDSIIYVKINTKINDDMIKKIKSKYVSEYLLKYYENATIDEVYIDKFYGVYNGAYVLIMTDGYFEYLTVLTYDRIMGYTFQYPNNNKIKVFYEDSFYTLSEAFFYKLLSVEDIKCIHEKFVK